MATNTRRIAAEIKEFHDGLYNKDHIYYRPDPVDITKGYALVLGSSDTPYENFPCYLEIQLPADYPHSPPKVKFLTYFQRVRFHPNLYVEGKVCLSILGTWQGPAWSPIMKISTVLLSIQSIMDKTPYCNEPGMKDNQTYNDAITYYVMKYKLDWLHRLSKGETQHAHEKAFHDILRPMIPQFLNDMKKQCETLPSANHQAIPYSIPGFQVDYRSLLPQITTYQATFGA